MNLSLQATCKALIEKYDNSIGENKDRIRNEIFCIMLRYIYKWLVSSFKKRGVFFQKEEILSISWDAFEYCMKAYKNREVPLPSHFAKNIDYFVTKYIDKENKMNKKIGSDFNEEEVYCEYNKSLCDNFEIVNVEEFLVGFRKFIGEEYAKIFDDIVFGRKEKVVAENGKYLPVYRYNEAKKVIKMVILYVLTGGEKQTHK